MSATAYLVGVLDTTTGQLLGFSVFSEPSPTMAGRRWPFVLLQKDGHTYDAAEFALRNAIADTPGLAWLKRYLLERGDSPLPDTVDLLCEGAGLVASALSEDDTSAIEPIESLMEWRGKVLGAVRRLRGEA